MPTIVLRSLLGRIGSLIALAGVLVFLAAILSDGGAGQALQAVGWMGLFGVIVWALWWAPLFIIAEDGLTVRGAWHTTHLAWDEVEEVEARWNLVLRTTEGRRISVAAAQRRGGIRESWDGHQRARARQMALDRGARGLDSTDGVDFSAIKPEYLQPSQERFRTQMDAVGAAELLMAYRQRREEHHKVLAHQAKRAARLARTQGESSVRGGAGIGEAAASAIPEVSGGEGGDADHREAAASGIRAGAGRTVSRRVNWGLIGAAALSLLVIGMAWLA